MYKVYSKINKNKLIYIKYDKELKLDLKDFIKNFKQNRYNNCKPEQSHWRYNQRERTKENCSKIK